MGKLESFIRRNRQEFDRHELPEGLFERISIPDRRQQREPRVRWLRQVAAAAVVIFAISTLFLLRSKPSAVPDSPLVQEVLTSRNYYAAIIDARLAELDNYDAILGEDKQDILGDLKELDEVYGLMVSELEKGVYSEDLLKAMIMNHRLQLDLLDGILDRLRAETKENDSHVEI